MMKMLVNHWLPEDQEIRNVMVKVDAALHGTRKDLAILALVRMLAVLLEPADPETRRLTLVAMPEIITSMLQDMDADRTVQ